MKLPIILSIPLLICVACNNDTTTSTDLGSSDSNSSVESAEIYSSSDLSSVTSSKESFSSTDKSSSSKSLSRSSSSQLSSDLESSFESDVSPSSNSSENASSDEIEDSSDNGTDSSSSNDTESSSSVICNPAFDNRTTVKKPSGEFEAGYTDSPMTIDGCNSESAWHNAPWNDMNYVWMSTGALDSSDYFGRFKVMWDTEYLYLLVDITDEHLFKTPTETYWQGDYVEVFIDYDNSGGDHLNNHQAFAYHVSTEFHAIDLKTNNTPHFFDSNLKAQRTKHEDRYLWEIAIHMYDDTFDESIKANSFEELTKDHTIGFSIAYGDNDGNNQRDHFVGSKETHGVGNDEGYKDSKVFGSVTFKKE